MLRQLTKLLLLFPLVLWGQQVYVFTTANGLPSNTVYDVVQDAKGFIWIATNKGVVKYNGKTFKTFTVQDGLPNNDTWKLEVTPDGKVWYASKSNRQGYIVNDSVYSFPVENNKTISPAYFALNKNKVGFFYHDSYFFENNEWKLGLNTSDIDGDGNNDYQVNDSINIARNISNFKIFAKRTSGFEIKLYIPVPYKLSLNGSANEPYGIYNEILWQVYAEGLVLVNLTTGKVRTISLDENQQDNLMFVWNNEYNLQWKTKTEVQIFDYNFNKLKTIEHPDLKDHTRAIVDNDGNLWMCSLSKGLKMIPATALAAKTHFIDQKVQRLQVLEDTLFAGIYNQSIAFYKEGMFRKTKLHPIGNIYKIKKLPPFGKYIAAATHSKSDHKTIQRQQLYKGEVHALKQDVNLFGLRDITLHGNDTYVLFHNLIAKSRSNEYFDVLQSVQGKNGFASHRDTLLVYGSDGLHVLAQDTLLPYGTQDTNRTISYLIAVSKKDRLFLGTDGFGVQVLENGTFTEIPETKGLSVNRIIQKDSLLWLATQRGVQVLKLNPVLKKSEIINSFYTADGILDKNVNDIAIQDSLLFVATDLGLSTLNLKSKEFSQKPVVYFDTKSDTLQFPFENAKNISIAFGTLDYTNQENIQYSYRLLPEQKDWQVSTSQSITFASLTPGDYSLEVTATDQHRNSATKSLTIKVLPAWWQTTYFKIAAMLIGLLVLGLLGWMLYRIAKKRASQKTEREKKLAGLELQALRSQMNPHFVHNSLNAIQYFVQRNEVTLSEKYLSKFSKLIRQFFEFSRKQTLPLSEEIDLLTNYLEIEKMRFEDKLDYTLEVDKTIDTENVVIPSMILQPIVENAINHGVFHKEGKGTIQLRFHKVDGHTLKIEIEDDGVGIERAKEIYKNSDRNYRSNSTLVLKERLELLSQNKDWKIEYSIKDKAGNKAITGTLVTLKLTPPYDT
ncbi:sensor histidine kinase [Marinirhabdus gelatinilytica]|uniref:Two component regulator with propeller domain n=1 Tax=Marinirhabdus gelatinilytica TaxID=1703343 RepID=A0A370QKJ6_9FLAO|nr:histidine kinase [Marinirhabdus gelatinilytica]RDK88580.1 two component regulator with propeller domain [Marinirhabdus gelatinilytica]